MGKPGVAASLKSAAAGEPPARALCGYQAENSGISGFAPHMQNPVGSNGN